MIFQKDFEAIYSMACIPYERLSGKSILISGATGLIGSTFVKAIEYYNHHYNLNCTIYALVRDLNKGRKVLGDNIILVEGAVEKTINLKEKIDYIIHSACPTESLYMVSNPVEVIQASVTGTINLLDMAKSCSAGFLFVSSMEVYGEVNNEQPLTENDLGYLNPLVIRNCYPVSKRMCEMIVASYASEYNVNAKSIRLAQTFGPGIRYDDKRVFAMMARSVIEGKDIVLKTKGESRHPYLYVTDAVSAMLTVLLNGEKGQSYNAANPSTYCSIYEMAELVINKFGQNKSCIRIMESDTNIYPKTTFLNLDIEKISLLKWKPTLNLQEMYDKLISYISNLTAKAVGLQKPD